MTITPKKLVFSVVGTIFLLIVIFNLPFTSVATGTKGVVTRGGRIVHVLDEGYHFKNPIDSVTEVVVQVQKEQQDTSAASKDLQTVSAKVALTYHLAPERVTDIYQSVRNDYTSRIIDPILNESVKAATAKYTAQELITKRELVRDEMKQNIVAKLEGTGLIVNDFNIVNFDFSAQFNAAIEGKVTAEQNAQKAQNQLVQVQAEAQQQIERAKAEAQTIRLQSDAANNDKYVELKRLEVQAAYANKWNGVLPVNLYGSAPIPFLNLTK